jgi:hypothetical protein
MKSVMFARAPFEITVIRLAQRETAMNLSDIMSRIECLEKKELLQGNVNNVPSECLSARPEAVLPEKKAPWENKGNEADSIKHRPLPPDEVLSSGSEERSEAEEPLDVEGFSDQKNKWKALLNYVKGRKMSVYIFLSSAQPLEIKAGSLVMGFEKANSFNKEALETEANRSVLQEAANKVLGQNVRISFKIFENEQNNDKTRAEMSEKKAIAKENMKPVIEKALDVFGGHVVRDFSEGA